MTALKDHAFLIATHGYSNDVFNEYKSVSKAVADYGKVFLLYHQKGTSHPPALSKVNHHLFTDAILHELSYVPLRNSLVPGSNHFPLLDFFLKHAGFKFYWYIEDDVAFNGNWKHFFNSFQHLPHDFISSYIKCWQQGSTWPWWELAHPVLHIELQNRLRSLNPVYRLSNRALSFLHQSLAARWVGHHEVLLPTLLYNNKFTLMDFGGAGEFVLPSNKNKFYTSRTYRWKPAFKKVGISKNKLYHPVKPVYSTTQPDKDIYAVYLGYQTTSSSTLVLLYKKGKKFVIKTLNNNLVTGSDDYHKAYQGMALYKEKKINIIDQHKGIWKEVLTQKEIRLTTIGKEVFFLKKAGDNLLLTKGNKEELFYQVFHPTLRRNILSMLIS